MFEFDLDGKTMFGDYNGTSDFVQDKVCPKCGTSLSYVLKTEILGCATCYKVFESEIHSRLLANQGSINHVGKISSKHFSKIKIKEKIEQLEKEKEKAADEENYIVAESLKNQIEKLKGEL